jgi:hypothetical protein
MKQDETEKPHVCFILFNHEAHRVGAGLLPLPSQGNR